MFCNMASVLQRLNWQESFKDKNHLTSVKLVAGTTVYMTQGTDNLSWMPIMMEHLYPSQHLTPPRTHHGETKHKHKQLVCTLISPPPPPKKTVFIFLFPSNGIRSSLGEYHKDSRNLKRIKDSSEFTHQDAKILCSQVTMPLCGLRFLYVNLFKFYLL